MKWLLLLGCLMSMEVAAMDVDELVRALQLKPHLEGGYFKRTFESSDRQKIDEGNGPRFTMTSIYYLLTAQSRIGHWHRNKSDIIHFFHLGQPITYYLIHTNGELETVLMGPDPSQGHVLQLAVKGGVWKASHLQSGDYGLISEAVSPGFEYIDMMLGDRAALVQEFPAHQVLIEKFTR